jgi:cytoskeletal protein CcmA (bactofilin family)
MSTACIGKSIHIKGTITAEEPLVVAGHVEGTISIAEHALSITADGRLDADAVADTIAIEGTAKGRLQATTRMTLRETATVIGEIVAPSVSMAEGATVQGKIDTKPKGSASGQASSKKPATSAA